MLYIFYMTKTSKIEIAKPLSQINQRLKKGRREDIGKTFTLEAVISFGRKLITQVTIPRFTEYSNKDEMF